MNEERRLQSPLGPYRVLDLTDEKGILCTKTLADLGADVIKIEPPGGDPVRNIGPFYHDIPHPEKSLYWFTFNTNKRGITLNLQTQDGRDIFRSLTKTADFVVETFPPGHLDKLGLAYDALSTLNSRLIMTSITPFGQSGPYRDFKGSDIVGMAMGGLMCLCGDPDRPPVRISTSQAYAQAGIQAAVGSLIAHYHREMTGEGQWVDASVQEAVTIATDNAQQAWNLTGTTMGRQGSGRTSFGRYLEMRYPCKDGHVSCVMLGADAFEASVEWMAGEGMAGDLTDPKWKERFTPEGLRETSQEELDHQKEIMNSFFMTHTKAELYKEGQARKLELTPMSTPKDLLEDAQLAARDYFVPVDHPELDDVITYPGAPFKMSRTPLKISRRAPLIGEHNEEIYEKELGFSKEELNKLKATGVI